MGTCTPKTLLNYQGNYQNRFNQNGTSNNGTVTGSGIRSGDSGYGDSQLRKYTSNGKGRDDEKKTFEITERLPVNGHQEDMVEEKMEIGKQGTHNVKPMSVLPQFQSIRRTVM